MDINRNDDDEASCSGKRIKTSDTDTDDVGPWSGLNHDMLSVVMMQLGVVDFLSFSGVCKSWRLKALPNMKMFMASKPPMLMCISAPGSNINNKECCLEDYEGRKFKTTLPRSNGRSCVGLTCGYLILFMLKTRDFWLVNPITRHELHFPPAPCVFYGRHVLVFSPLRARYVFLMLDIFMNHIWYSIAGEGEGEGDGAWMLVSSTHRFHNLHAFKGKIYTLSPGKLLWKVRCLYELKLNPQPKITLLKTNDCLNEDLYLTELVSSGENLYLMKSLAVGGLYKVHKLDFGKMEWVQFEDTIDEHAFFLSDLKYRAAVKSDSWAQHERFSRHGRFFTANQWYFPHECLNVNLLDES